MIHKKPGLLCSSFSALQAFQCPSHHSATCRYSPPAACSNNHQRHQRASYAQVTDSNNNITPEGESQQQQQDAQQHLPWPNPVPPHKVPTPYQIFGLKPNEPYSKTTFNQLVKTYHPDRAQHDLLCPLHIRHVPHHIRLERYRLIITAHAILSNPTKRSKYDNYGEGWAGHPSADGASGMPEQRQWKDGESPMNNATWEDWEKWHNRDSREPQSPLYLSNGAFVAIIILVATGGAVAEASRAKTWGNSFMEQREVVHGQAVKDLQRARLAASAAGGHKGRIEAFLRHKDGTAYADEAYKRVLPEPEVCSSGEITATREKQ